jgi:Uma2 family endonuclease
MLKHPRLHTLLTEYGLPDTNEQPVDNKLQVLVPALLRAILALLWGDRNDWLVGVNLGLYYDPNLPAIDPNGGFLSLGVPRLRCQTTPVSRVDAP